MDACKVLLLPFYCDGYDREIAASQITQTAVFLRTCGMEVTTAETIETAAQAYRAAESYNPYCYDLPVLLPVTWSEPRLAAIAARQFFGLPIAIVCVREFLYKGRRTEMSSTPAAAALRGSLQEMGVACEFFPDLPQTEADAGRFRALAAAARAVRVLRTAKLGFFGHNFNGITAADFDLSLLRRRFGTEVYSFDVSELLARMNGLDKDSEAWKQTAETVKQKIHGKTGKYGEKIIRMTLALRQYVEEYGLDALAVRCHTELSQTYGLTACLPLGILGDELPCSCEADLPVTLTQLLLSALSGGKTTLYADLRTFHDDGIDAASCGYAPCALTGGRAEVGGQEAPECATGPGYLTNKNGMNEGRVTMARMLKFPGGKLALHLTEGTAKAEPSYLQEYGCPYYPMAKITPDLPMAQFLEYVGANHYAVIYDELAEAAKLFCKYTGVEFIG